MLRTNIDASKNNCKPVHLFDYYKNLNIWQRIIASIALVKYNTNSQAFKICNEVSRNEELLFVIFSDFYNNGI